MTRCNWCGLDSETHDICAWCKRPIASNRSAVPARPDLHFLRDADSEPVNRSLIGVIIGIVAAFAAIGLVTFAVLSVNSKSTSTTVAAAPPSDPNWSNVPNQDAPAPSNRSALTIPSIPHDERPISGGMPVPASRVTVNPYTGTGQMPTSLKVATGDPNNKILKSLRDSPADTLGIAPGSSPSVYVESVNFIPVPDDQNIPRVIGSVVVVNISAETIHKPILYLMVNDKRYALTPILGPVTNPHEVDYPEIPPKSSQEYPVYCPKFDARATVSGKRIVRFEGSLYGTSVFAETEIGRRPPSKAPDDGALVGKTGG